MHPADSTRRPIFNKVGILHPGAMGVAVAASVKNSGCEVYWCSEGRGARTRDRAERAGLQELVTLAQLCERCDLIISVCPPEFAESLADDVARLGFRGAYLDANAVAPARKQRMATKLESAGIHFVDGGIIGLPPKAVGETCILLSGSQATDVATCFAAGPIEPEVIGTDVGKASAAKACFAAYNKGSIALAISVLRTADHYGVREDLERHWARRGAKFARLEAEIVRAAPKAWRWAPEMLELAATLEFAGESPKFHEAAAALFERLGDFKDADGVSLDEVIRMLRLDVRPTRGSSMSAEQITKIEKTRQRLEVTDANLSGSSFDDVKLTAATFHNVNLTGTTIHDANLSGVHITHANFEGMTIDGVAVSALFEAYRKMRK